MGPIVLQAIYTHCETSLLNDMKEAILRDYYFGFTVESLALWRDFTLHRDKRSLKQSSPTTVGVNLFEMTPLEF